MVHTKCSGTLSTLSLSNEYTLARVGIRHGATLFGTSFGIDNLNIDDPLSFT